MLFTALKQTGRSLSNSEAKVWQASVVEAEKALKEKQLANAAKALIPLKKFGPLDKMQSYSKFVLSAKKIVTDIEKGAGDKLQSAIDSFTTSKPTFENVYTLVSTEASFTAFPKLKAKATQAIGKVKRNKAWRATVDQAKALYRARTYRQSASKTIRRRAATAYEGIIRKFPGAEVATIAKAELKKIAPASTALTDTPATKSEFREWTDSSGQFKTTAKLVELKAGKVKLLRRDGKTIVIPLERLSSSDQQHLKANRSLK